jgi:uncharacterized protein
MEDDSKFIYFNGMTGAVFDMGSNEHQRMSSLWDDLTTFEQNYNSVFKRFVEWGFIVPKEIDEIDRLRFNNKTAVFSDKFYRLIMNPTTDCIFNCWYCDQHSQDKGKMSGEVMDKIKKHIDYMVNIDRITGLHLDWFGGEPLMYFEEIMIPLSKYAMKILEKNKIPFINQITTNGYLIDKQMILKMKDLKLNIFQITIDGDEKRHNKIRNVNGEPSFQRIIENINLILNTIPDSKITLRINFDDSTLKVSNFNNVFSLISKQYRARVFISLQRVWQTIKKNTDENDNYELIKLRDSVLNLGYTVSETSAFHIGRPIKCYGDRLYNTVIDYDGKIYKCTARTHKEAGSLNDDGSITWNHDTMTRLYAKPPFENEQCLACKHLPICLGTCIQNHSGSSIKPDKCSLEHAEINVESFIKSFMKRKKVLSEC